ncbi:class F sortase [Streptacidiphilus sp. N1-12]|uniref:Class F sortase n=2 Tax=Streptacidiphilus alkalitolerans TaxID=3342712 RepID=A0ABV6WG12_9ACTN
MDQSAHGRGGTLRRTVLGTPAIVAICLGVWLIGHGAQAPTPPPQPSAAQAFPAYDSAGEPSAASPLAPAVPPLPPSAPTRVRIPSIKVDAPLTALSLDSTGRLVPPPDNNQNLAGWYRDGTSPGATGTAVLAGHVDTEQGAAVFYNLGALKKGQTVDVDRADGVTAVFTIDAIEVYTAQQFPSKKVYGPATRPELRLITCGAGFDKARQEYLGNVVVYAHLTSSHGGVLSAGGR